MPDMERMCWVIACVNMSLSLVASTLAAHYPKLDEAGKKSMQWGINIH